MSNGDNRSEPTATGCCYAKLRSTSGRREHLVEVNHVGDLIPAAAQQASLPRPLPELHCLLLLRFRQLLHTTADLVCQEEQQSAGRHPESTHSCCKVFKTELRS